MIKKSFHKYIKDYILKNGEELEWNSTTIKESLIEVNIIKRSQRIYRVVGQLTLSTQMTHINDLSIGDKLKSLTLTPRKKVNLDDNDRQTFKWLEEGLIIKEVRFEKDEKTVQTSHYRMGFHLYQYEQLKIQQKRDNIHTEFVEIKNRFLEMSLLQSHQHHNFYYQRKFGIQNIIQVMIKLEPSELRKSLQFPKGWSIGKRLKFLQFVIALFQLSLHKEEYDWKEIGASYFQKIGGSKEFDSYKQEFLEQIEEWANVPMETLGLISLGQITPVFFSGQLTGKYATYDWGSVHALTNLSIVNEEFKTKATTLWLVENRAILTRMEATEGFLKETNSLIICIDGHLRSAHKNAISQILSNSSVEQVIIWCDYDPDGFQISNEIYSSIEKFNELNYKWILPDQLVTDNNGDYGQDVTIFFEDNQMERELLLGGEDKWKKWILD